jgi:aryl-alcohol dehydrogenase-like predicted oxidoreductase
MINRVTLPGTGISTSALGMGCASLGSRVPADKGLRALEAAFDAGVCWFDVAPAYGAGQAEAILAGFLKGRRDRVQLCSKVGLAAPRMSPAKQLAYRLGRPLMGVARGLRGLVRKSGATANVALPLTPELIYSSLDMSLARLGCDYLDVLALHEASPQDLALPAVREALQAVVQAGKVRQVAVAGSAQAAQAALAFPQLYTVLQLADDPATLPLVSLRAQAGERAPGFITHSVFGVGGARAQALARLQADAALRARVLAAGYTGPDEQMVADLLLDRAFASNLQGVVLASMYSPRHLASNVARAARPVAPQAVDLVAGLFSASPA